MRSFKVFEKNFNRSFFNLFHTFYSVSVCVLGSLSPSGLVRVLLIFNGPHEPFGVLDEKYGKNQVHEVSRMPLKTMRP